MRSVGDDERELALESYQTFAATDLLADGILARMLAGLSTRRYEVGLEPVGVEQVATGTSKSSVSRRFVAATAERLAELCARPLGDQVVFLADRGLDAEQGTLPVPAGEPGVEGVEGWAGPAARRVRC